MIYGSAVKARYEIQINYKQEEANNIMKQTGMIRQFDELGRVVIPKDMREQHGWGKGSPVEIIANDEYVIIKPYVPNSEKQRDIAALENAISYMKDIPSTEETIIKLEKIIERMK